MQRFGLWSVFSKQFSVYARTSFFFQNTPFSPGVEAKKVAFVGKKCPVDENLHDASIGSIEAPKKIPRVSHLSKSRYGAFSEGYPLNL